MHSSTEGSHTPPATTHPAASGRRRRRLPARLRILTALSVAFVLVVTSCASTADSSSEGSSDTTTAAAVAGLDISPGSEIPTVDLKFGMKPFPDSTFYAVGIERGYFDDVGLNIVPKPFGTELTPDTVVPMLVNGDIDIATINGPGTVKVMSQVPDLKMFGFADTYEATYLLASPDSGVEAVSDRVEGGQDPAEAIADAMKEVKGRAVAFNNAGSQRVFLNTIFNDYGGISFDDVDLTVTDDASIVQLALGGQIDFATPDGAGQNVELLRLGWYPLVSVSDLAAIPESENVVAASLSHEGPAAMSEWLDANQETALRFLSVMFRLIDEIEADPDSAFAVQLPYLISRSGTDIGVEGLKEVFNVIDPLAPFEDQDQFWDESVGGARYYGVVYGEQIRAAQEGGILPAGNLEPGSNIIGAEYYEKLLELKAMYDELLPEAEGLSGEAATLAEEAAQQYEWHNYLDAYRMIREATSG
jgi:ABC-type nitrate/sulfonate/bicarbonate transport system substrate-binding protein